MKKIIVLMGVLVCSLSCQKDIDKVYPNVNSPIVNNSASTVQSCGPTAQYTVVMHSSYLRYESDTHEINPPGVTQEMTMEDSNDSYNLGVSIFHDHQFVYVQAGYDGLNYIELTSSDGLRTFTGEYAYVNGESALKFPISDFYTNEVIIADFNYPSTFEFTDYYIDGFLDTVVNFYLYKYADPQGVFYYTVSPCPNPNE
ncbi:hypothetical protein [Solitalea canadensis]|uniref:Uncharacterized protein n=1 Tax=Solitalea canadensis (strain ATCC 29591 / DSM 3403 / JCM 21819 / LMG 8368 / NBRC 15130 / NCIMB 12057 / USAM 9D) TaxID=929556 RepID=H8KR21_SOLCM|nr:hypothetical protein [Solitalea canadensis]AFD07167.1 hypothetical protein Solca_2113 [Solitalea canadensis DSM 3403]